MILSFFLFLNINLSNKSVLREFHQLFLFILIIRYKQKWNETVSILCITEMNSAFHAIVLACPILYRNIFCSNLVQRDGESIRQANEPAQ